MNELRKNSICFEYFTPTTASSEKSGTPSKQLLRLPVQIDYPPVEHDPTIDDHDFPDNNCYQNCLFSFCSGNTEEDIQKCIAERNDCWNNCSKQPLQGSLKTKQVFYKHR
jgi:hypothetical protein